MEKPEEEDDRAWPTHCSCCDKLIVNCLVSRELRQTRTPEGRKQAMEDYRQLLRERQEFLDKKEKQARMGK